MSQVLDNTATTTESNDDFHPCNNASTATGNQFDWSKHEYATEKTELLKYIVQMGSKTPILNAARSVFGNDIPPNSSEVQLTRRFFTNHPELFQTEKIDGLQWVEPRSAAFNLISSMHCPKTQDGTGESDVKQSKRSQSPKELAKNVLADRNTVESDDVRALLLHALATRREQTENIVILLEHLFDDEQYLAIPHEDRFNSSRRVNGGKYQTLWETAAERYNKGVVVTLTTNPARQSSMLSSIEGLYEDIERLKSWLSYDPQNGPSRLGRRVPTIVVPEFTHSGLAHVHIVFFGTAWVAHGDKLSWYWSENRNRGRVVDFERIESRNSEWRWADSENRKRPRNYLGKTLFDLYQLAQSRPQDIRDVAEAQKSCDSTLDSDFDEWWKLALYWATELRIFSHSPSLTPDSGEEDEEEIYTQWWSFLGVVDAAHIPENIREGLEFEPRPPNREPPPECVI